MNIVALAGGVGGAKLADGLQHLLADHLTVIANTGDDFELLGLRISPDLDTVMYTLAGLANPETGWGIEGDTFDGLEMIARYRGEDWFRLGDRDLATHILRTQRLREGKRLSDVTYTLSRALGVRATLLPMTDQAVRTLVNTDEGELPFQEYFVRRRWQPVLRSIRFSGIEQAHPADGTLAALARADAIVLCPSNPLVSIAPILAVPEMRAALKGQAIPKIAVSPIVGGEALKGPAGKMFHEMGVEPSAFAVAQSYAGLINGFVMDRVDAGMADQIQNLGMDVRVTNTVMGSVADRVRLAQEIIDWIAHKLGG